ncbi:hypothetical protein J2Z32_003730 [Paenibacillus turicensis]|uniref:Uncharacterized protein n=1 Tax=Paenibacillus turicensis TaxID=160487 RepID=A0ABS4FWW1_9BACL|nr:hypothetical protein [Paenibacillus turicensis]MBP1907065.1 hypothetical protein [Paenibacillus turicensis]
MNIEITKESDALICLLYKKYSLARKDGATKEEAIAFGSSLDIFNNIAPKWNESDVDSACRELGKAKLLDIPVFADDIAWQVSLSDKGIVYMENRFKDGLNGLLDYLAKIKSIIPFL